MDEMEGGIATPGRDLSVPLEDGGEALGVGLESIKPAERRLNDQLRAIVFCRQDNVGSLPLFKRWDARETVVETIEQDSKVNN